MNKPKIVSQVVLRRTCFPQLCIGSACMALDGGRRFSPQVVSHLPLLGTPWSFTALPGHCLSMEGTGLPLPGMYLLIHEKVEVERRVGICLLCIKPHHTLLKHCFPKFTNYAISLVYVMLSIPPATDALLLTFGVSNT